MSLRRFAMAATVTAAISGTCCGLLFVDVERAHATGFVVNSAEPGLGESGAPSLPFVGGWAVSDLAPGAAIVSATVGSGGLSTKYAIDLGTDVSYGTQTTGEIIGVSQAVSMILLYLKPSTTYHYKITATNLDGVASSGDQTFTTPAYPILLPQVLPQIAAPSIAFPVESAVSKVKPKHKTTKHRKLKHKSKKHKSKKKK